MTKKNNKARIVALHLPQFHPIPENDAWWGEGFTEWTNVKKAQPRFKGHHQPRVPSTLGYYDLRTVQAQKVQMDLASEHGIEAFCYYHYWFNSKLLLEKPVEAILKSPELRLSFCLCWANENWTRRWDGENHEVLIAQDYNHDDTYAHAKYLAQFFLDPRYLRVGNVPVFIIYRANLIPNLEQRLKSMRQALHEFGVPEVSFYAMSRGKQTDAALTQAGIERFINFEPSENTPVTGIDLPHLINVVRNLVTTYVKPLIRRIYPQPDFDLIFNYQQIVQKKIRTPLLENHIPCVFPNWDNSSRRKTQAVIIQNSNANLFQSWLTATIEKIQSRPKDEQLIFINAWNEWAEGCYLEPDHHNGDKFLKAVKNAVLEAPESV